MLIPLDFPFAVPIKIRIVMPDVFKFMYQTRFSLLSFDLSFFTLVTLIWLLGAVYFFTKLVMNYQRVRKYIQENSICADDRYGAGVERIIRGYKRPKKIHVYQSEETHSPMAFGIRRHVILIPNVELSLQDWELVFRHEIAHFYHQDLVKKLVFEIINVINWWNPIFYLYKVVMGKLIELTVDTKVTAKLDEQKSYDYLQCLTKVARNCMTAKKDSMKRVRFAKQLIERPVVITERIYILLAEIPKNKKGRFINYAFVTGMVFFSFILPTFVTFTPFGVTPEVAETSFTNEDRSIFYIALEDGSYDLYVESVYVGNQKDPTLLKGGIQIYKSLEEALKHEEIFSK
jgi:hypothetical protein